MTTSSASVVRSVHQVAPVTRYYLALGDSIAAGLSATSTNGYRQPPPHSYVGLVYQHERSLIPGLKMVSYACGGATTVSMIDGPNPCQSTGRRLPSYEPGPELSPQPPQPSDLGHHRYQGFNDIYGCFLPKKIKSRIASRPTDSSR